MTILIFLGVLFLLVLVHEFGHFIVAKKTGMRVDEFGIGFPPRVWGKKFGETLYSLNILPIGGFVKIYGEDGLDETPGDVVGEEHSSATANYESGAFTSKSRWAQAAVLVAGVAMNVLFAWFLFTIAFMAGVTRPVEESSASSEARLIIASVLEDGPADRSGVPEGAIVRKIERSSGEVLDTLSPTRFSTFIASTESQDSLTLTYEIGGEETTAEIVSQTGLISGESERSAVGVALSLVDTVRMPFHTAVYEGGVYTVHGLVAITTGIAGLAWDALRFDADLSQVAGPVGIVNLVGEATAFGLTTLLMFTGFISLNLAVINLLPFPALDGGRLLFVIIEAVKGTAINPKYTAILNTAGFALLILLMIVITYSDIMKLF